jgi:NitT/TauT family transport system substrate-binding protein
MHTFRRREVLKGIGSTILGLGVSHLAGCLPGQPLGQPRMPAETPKGEDQPLRIGYLPITDASPLLIADALRLYQEEGLGDPKVHLLRSWAQIVEAFQAREVNVVHLLMPTAIWLRYARQFPARVIAWNHLNGSALTVGQEIQRLQDLAGKTVAIPFWYSIHNVILQMLLDRAGLRPLLGGEAHPGPQDVRLVVMPPPEMPAALSAGQIAGFIVAEPFGALAEAQGHGHILRFTGDVWKEHACCVVVVHEDDLQERPLWVQAVTRAVVRAQIWLRQNRMEAARLLSRAGRGYLPQPPEVLEQVFSMDLGHYAGVLQHSHWQPMRIDFQPYPYPSYTQALVQALRETLVEGETEFLSRLEPAFVAQDLVDEEPVRQAVEEVGGLAVFSQPDTWQREEMIEP